MGCFVTSSRTAEGRARTLLCWRCRRCLEVGCGSGFVICSVALALQHIRSNTPGTPAAAGHSTEDAAVPCCCSTPPCSFLGIDISAAALQATTATLKAHQASLLHNSTAYSTRLGRLTSIGLFWQQWQTFPKGMMQDLLCYEGLARQLISINRAGGGGGVGPD